MLTWNFFDTTKTGWCPRRTRVGRMPLASFFTQALYAISFDEVFEDAFASRVRVTARGQSDERIRRRNRYYIKKSYGKYEIPFLPLPLLYDYT